MKDPRLPKTLAAAWAHYRERVVPVDAGHYQVHGTRTAFYAGAASMFDLIRAVGDPQAEGVTDAELDAVTALHDELEAFALELGRARQQRQERT